MSLNHAMSRRSFLRASAGATAAAAALGLAPHGRDQRLLVWKQRANQIHIHAVAGDHIRLLKRAHGAKGHLVGRARADAHHRQLIQRKSSNPASRPPRSRRRRGFF